jgi:hypothetical protein
MAPVSDFATGPSRPGVTIPTGPRFAWRGDVTTSRSSPMITKIVLGLQTLSILAVVLAG